MTSSWSHIGFIWLSGGLRWKFAIYLFIDSLETCYLSILSAKNYPFMTFRVFLEMSVYEASCFGSSPAQSNKVRDSKFGMDIHYILFYYISSGFLNQIKIPEIACIFFKILIFENFGGSKTKILKIRDSQTVELIDLHHLI